MSKVKQFFVNLVTKIKLDGLKEFIRKNPHMAFIVGLVLLVLLSLGISQAVKYNHQQQLNQLRQQTKETPPAQQVKQQTQQQQAQQAQKPPQMVMWKGVPVLTSGPVAPTAPASAAALDGSVITEPLVLSASASGDLKNKENVQASVTFPLAGRYQKMSFVLAQQGLTGDMQAYAYSTRIQIVADGKTLLDKTITKDALLAKAQPVTLDIAGANQAAVKFETGGKKYKRNPTDTYFETTDQYGPFFPVVLGGLVFE